MLGEKFGDYEIVRLIGRGGMGAVYEGHNPAISRRAAIKVLLPEFAKVEDTVRRFFNEARAVNTINHAGVVQVSDVGTRPDGSLYLVMEFLEGQTLAERLYERGGFLTEPEVIAISWQLTGVLAAAHAKSIIHRDIKPGNIMLVPDLAAPAGERVKLLDFGIAKLGADRGEDANTRKGEILGTATYMAPEQFQNAQTLDGQADVYSLAVVMYRMVCGKVPFVSTSGEFGLAALHMFQQHQSLLQVAPQTAPWLSELIDAMLRKDRTKRPNMSEVGDELQQHMSFRPPPKRMSGDANLVRSVDLEIIVEEPSGSLFAPTTDAVTPPPGPGTPLSFVQKQLAAGRRLWAEKRPFVVAGMGALALLLCGIIFFAARPRKPHVPPVPTGQVDKNITPPQPARDATTNSGITPAATTPGTPGTPGTDDQKDNPAARPLKTKDGKPGGSRRRFKIIN